jgi:hypothetical protein
MVPVGQEIAKKVIPAPPHLFDSLAFPGTLRPAVAYTVSGDFLTAITI